MIFNMVGGGAGSAGGGATLVVSSPANVSVTVSKDDKSYTKNSGPLGSATFKGLVTGTWTVVASGNGQTATRTIEITADYTITIAFFSATINITYPANSNCVVTNSSGQTVASDTNATSSEKTFTAIVGSTGTYTVTATATDGSGGEAIEDVEIVADGQTKSIYLSYGLWLFKEGVGLGNGIAIRFGTQSGNPTVSPQGIIWSEDNSVGNSFDFTYNGEKIDCSKYSVLKVQLACGTRHLNSTNYNVVFGLTNNPVRGENYIDGYVAQTDKIWNTNRDTYVLPLVDDKGAHIALGSYYVMVGAHATTGTVYNAWFEE